MTPRPGQEPIGVIGLGLMGTALTERLLEHGHRVAVWNRTRAKAAPLVAQGAEWSDNPLATCRRVIISLYSNSVGPQGGGKWSAGDSNIVAPDGALLQLADNRREGVIVETLELSRATRRYVLDGLEHPRFLVPHWRRIVAEARRRVRSSDRAFQHGLAQDKTV